MFSRFERQTLGRPAHADPAHLPLKQAGCQRIAVALSRAECTVQRRHREKRPAERAERAQTLKHQQNQGGCRRADRWRKLAETGGNPQDNRYGDCPGAGFDPVVGDI
jgi:hypothetical protein